jgi:hypothetical protein
MFYINHNQNIPGDSIRSVDPIVLDRIRVEFHRDPIPHESPGIEDIYNEHQWLVNGYNLNLKFNFIFLN